MPQISDFLDEFDSEHTRRAYGTDLRCFLQEMGLDKPSADFSVVDTRDVEGFLESMQASELSTSTVRRRMAAVRRFFDWLVSVGEIGANPCRAASLTVEASVASQEREVLSMEDLQALLEVTNDDTRSGTRDRALILLILYGALRRSEVASLDVDDVRPLGRDWVIDLPRRGRTPGAYVKIPASAADAVQELVDLYGEESGPLWRSFSNRNWGERMSPDALYKRVRHIGKAADLQGVDIRTLRRSALRLASMSGASLEQIRDHARLKRETSAAEYVGGSSRSSRLTSGTADFLELDV